MCSTITAIEVSRNATEVFDCIYMEPFKPPFATQPLIVFNSF